jgi:hypothetical protein
MCIVHVSLVPIIGVVGEQKTKPTQHSVAVLRSLGLHPDLLACRCSEPLDDSVRQKLVSGAGRPAHARVRGKERVQCGGSRTAPGQQRCQQQQQGAWFRL